MTIVNTEKWQACVDSNTDSYGKACVDIARQVMKLLDEVDEFTPHNLICRAEDEIGEDGLTGFMAAMVARMVWQVHSRGDEFRLRWNNEWGVSEDKEGIVNPAIMTISTEQPSIGPT